MPIYLAKLPHLHSWALLSVCALSTPFGVGLGWALTAASSGEGDAPSASPPPHDQLTQAIIISLSSGSFLYISLCELLPSALADGRSPAAKLGAFAVGYLSMAVLAVYA